MKLRSLSFLFTFLIVLSAQAQSQGFLDMRSYFLSKKANKNIQEKQKEQAYQNNLKALEYEPDLAILQSNLGVTFDLNEKKDEAEKVFRHALGQAKTDEEKYSILFNLGYLLGSQKKVEAALEAYQQALDIKPSSLEVKHNIELLIQQQQKDQQQKDKDKNQGQGGDSSDPQKPSEDKDKEKKKDPQDSESEKDKDKDKKEQEKPNDQDRKQTQKYKPRPFQGEQLSEGDVKKILGELSRQDQKIRSQFNKKEQRKEDANAKDW